MRIFHAMTYAANIIDRFGGIRKLATLLGHKNASTVQGWKERGSIPDRHKAKVIAAAQSAGINLRPEHFFATTDTEAPEAAVG